MSNLVTFNSLPVQRDCHEQNPRQCRRPYPTVLRQPITLIQKLFRGKESMGTIAETAHPPRKRRRKQNTQNAVPKWETTRVFEDTKFTPSALPTITEDGAVRRPASTFPKFVVNSKNNKSAAAEGQSALQPSDIQPDICAGKPSSTNQSSEKKNAPFKVTRKRQRQELEKYAKKIEDFEATKANIASIATKVVANPEDKVALFKQLRQMAQHHKGKSAALTILTEAQLYKDVAPAYRIRPITEKEAETKVSKEVARLRNFEEAFLVNYQRFVKYCISVSRWRPGGANETTATKNMKTVRVASCRALGELISALPHFNDANLIATAVCALVMDREEEVRTHSTSALKAVLQGAHRASGQTLEICVLIAKTLAGSAAGKQKAAPEEVLLPLVSIQFANFPLLPTSSKKKNEPKKSKRFIKKRRRKQKEEPNLEETELERDLGEADAGATPQELFTAKKSLLDAACHAYFNIIKAAKSDINREDLTHNRRKRVKKPPPALSGALKGLLRVSTFVSTDVLEAILGALTLLITEGCLPLGTRFRCLSAAYAILAKNSSASKTDPDSFTGDIRAMDSALYAALGCLYGPDTPLKEEEYIAFDVAETVMTARSRREIPTARCTALARRLSILSASATPTHACAISLLLAAQQLMSPSLVSPIYVQKGQRNGELGGNVGTVQRLDLDTDDPDIANAERSASWELSCLACHFHPSVREIAMQVAAGNCGSQLCNTKETIVLRAKSHKSAEGGFNPAPVTSLATQNRAKLSRKTSLLDDNVLLETLPEASDRVLFLVANNSDWLSESNSPSRMKLTACL